MATPASRAAAWQVALGRFEASDLEAAKTWQEQKNVERCRPWINKPLGCLIGRVPEGTI